jgi:hypothetical protein
VVKAVWKIWSENWWNRRGNNDDDFFIEWWIVSSSPKFIPSLGQLTAMTCTLTSIPYSLHIFGNFCISLVIYICRSSVKVYKLKTVSI